MGNHFDWDDVPLCEVCGGRPCVCRKVPKHRPTYERDRFLTEKMGVLEGHSCTCEYEGCFLHQHAVDLSTWGGFGQLWEWCIVQDWFSEVAVALNHHEPHPEKGYSGGYNKDIGIDYVDPERFAGAIYEYLKEK